jgi:hypothetical protein
VRDMEIVRVSKDARYSALKREIPPVVYFHDDQGYTEPNWRRRFSCAPHFWRPPCRLARRLASTR